MTPITEAYLACALWSSSDDKDIPFDSEHSIFDLAPESIVDASLDCFTFWHKNMALLEKSGLTDEQIGHDFWLTRNGHGAGFWDRGLGEIGEKLTEGCKAFHEKYVYSGDDGLIYIQ